MLSGMTRQTDTPSADQARPSPVKGAAMVRRHHTPRAALERAVLASSRPRPVDPAVAAEQDLRLRREEAQRRFDTIGLPRATRLSEVRP